MIKDIIWSLFFVAIIIYLIMISPLGGITLGELFDGMYILND